VPVAKAAFAQRTTTEDRSAIPRKEARMIREGFETQYTREGEIRATGFGSEESAYKRLLLNLCKSGCKLPEIRISSSPLFTIVYYKVQGTQAEIEHFSKLVNG
jgi:hypothetical protein